MKSDIENPIFQDEEKARLWLEAQRWPDGPVCPVCKKRDRVLADADIRSRPSAANPEGVVLKGVYRCARDRKRFTVRTGTLYERSHIPLHKWLYATHLLCSSKKGMSALQLHRMLGVSRKSAWFMAHRIRVGMRGIYQHCSEAHLHRYLAEFDFRYSNREALGCDDRARTLEAIKGIEGKRLTYRGTNQAANA